MSSRITYLSPSSTIVAISSLPRAVLPLLTCGMFAKILHFSSVSKIATVEINVGITAYVLLPKSIRVSGGDFIEFNKEGTPVNTVSESFVADAIKASANPLFNHQ